MDRSVRPRHPGELRHRVREAAELGLALPQRFFGASALGPAPHSFDRLGNIVGGSGSIGGTSREGDHAAGREAGVLADRERGIFGDEGGTVLTPQEFVVEPHGPAARERMEQRAGRGRVDGAVRAGMVDHLVHVAAQKLIGRPVTEHRQRRPVHEGASPGRVDPVNPVAEPVQQVPLHRSVPSGEADRGTSVKPRRSFGRRTSSLLMRWRVRRRRHEDDPAVLDALQGRLPSSPDRKTVIDVVQAQSNAGPAGRQMPRFGDRVSVEPPSRHRSQASPQTCTTCPGDTSRYRRSGGTKSSARIGLLISSSATAWRAPRRAGSGIGTAARRRRV